MVAETIAKENASPSGEPGQLAESVAKIQVDDGSVESADEDEVVDADAAAIAKKKKKNKKKKKKSPKVQTDPPSVPLSRLFAGERYPEGELFPYGQDDNTQRVTGEEIRAKERECDEWVNNLRKGGEIHRQVRDYARRNIQPGMSMIEITESIEKQVRDLTAGSTWKEAGNGFPTGVSVNDCAAHYTPNKGDKKVLQKDDVLKLDFGVQVGGRIVDSAFTMTWNDRYDPLLAAVRNATNAGIAAAGIDARLGEIGGAVQEVMESYEIELNGKTHPIRAIRNLCGHNISPYQIHGGKSVPIIACENDTKMEEGEVFAIETFGSTGRGLVIESGECSHYALLPNAAPANLRLQSAKQLYNVIDQTFGTLPFCRRWLDLIGQERYLLALNSLVKSNVVQDYPPLMDSVNSYTAQFEHTLVLRPTAKEIISRGDDY